MQREPHREEPRRQVLPRLTRANMETITGNSHTYDDEETARLAFRRQRERFFDINHWGELGTPDPMRAQFVLHDAAGNKVIRMPHAGDFIEITLPPSPGIPGHAAGHPDWVRIDRILDEQDRLELVIRPSYNPTESPVREHVTQHFFRRETTNTFKLHRLGRMLVCVVHGEHEYANSDPHEAGGIIKAARNRIVAETGWGVGRQEAGVGSADQHLILEQKGGQKPLWETFTANMCGAEGDPLKAHT